MTTISGDDLAKGYFELAQLHKLVSLQYKKGDYRRIKHRKYAEQLDDLGMGFAELGNMDLVDAAGATEVRHD